MPRPPLVSQHGEDHLLLSAFDGEGPGFYIDVGAFDGLHLSNTWVFEQLGWQGYCLEPSPRVFALLQQHRPRAQCVGAAAGSEPGELELFVDPTMLLSTTTGDESAVREAYDRAARTRELDTADFDRVTVPVVTLDDLLRRHAPPPRIDLVSIDVEGAELAVLDGFDLAHHQPRVLVLEANDQAMREAIVERCEDAGYRHARSLGNNLFFALEDRLVYRLRTTSVECFLPRNLHPFGLEFTHPDLRADRIVVGGRSFPLSDVASLLRQGGLEAHLERSDPAAGGGGAS